VLSKYPELARLDVDLLLGRLLGDLVRIGQALGAATGAASPRARIAINASRRPWPATIRPVRSSRTIGSTYPKRPMLVPISLLCCFGLRLADCRMPSGIHSRRAECAAVASEHSGDGRFNGHLRQNLRTGGRARMIGNGSGDPARVSFGNRGQVRVLRGRTGRPGGKERKRPDFFGARRKGRKTSTNPGPWISFRPRAFYLTQHSPDIRPPIGPFIATFTKR
jgi:hypothetical protein